MNPSILLTRIIGLGTRGSVAGTLLVAPVYYCGKFFKKFWIDNKGKRRYVCSPDKRIK